MKLKTIQKVKSGYDGGSKNFQDFSLFVLLGVRLGNEQFL
jgi:hypothetical protein